MRLALAALACEPQATHRRLRCPQPRYAGLAASGMGLAPALLAGLPTHQLDLVQPEPA